MIGKIISIRNGTYVIYKDKVTYNTFITGLFRFKKEHLYVGDDVYFDDDNFTIKEKLPRKNFLIRPSAANIDQLFIVMSVKEPDFSKLLLYKFLTYANMNNIKAKVIFTKTDLEFDHEKIKTLIDELKKLEIDCYLLSKDDKTNIDLIKKDLDNKTSIFMGQTGVGKSSLINLIDPSYQRQIGSYSQALGRGKHQTKEIVLLPYLNGFIGDTPGFSSLELNIYKEDLAQYFPGYQKYFTQCYFSNCLHQNEKDCNIKKQIDNSILSLDSYKIYLKLLDELQYKNKRFK